MLHGCQAGGQRLLQGPCFCVYQEVTELFFPFCKRVWEDGAYKELIKAVKSLTTCSFPIAYSHSGLFFSPSFLMVIYLSPLVNSEYPCEMIPILNVVLFKTADSSLDIREKAAQLLQLLER